MPSSGTKSVPWWAAIEPSTEYDWSLVAQPACSILPVNIASNAVRQSNSGDKPANWAVLGLNRTWSTYDSIKLKLGHETLKRVVSIIRSSAFVSESRQSVSSELDVVVVAQTFCLCGELLRTKSYSSENSLLTGHGLRKKRNGIEAKHISGQENWLTSTKNILPSGGSNGPTGFGLAAVASLAKRAAGLNPMEDNMNGSDDKVVDDYIQVANDHSDGERSLDHGEVELESMLVFVTENLISTLYSYSLTLSSKELAKYRADILASVELCELFPSHSFISEVGRWLGKMVRL